MAPTTNGSPELQKFDEQIGEIKRNLMNILRIQNLTNLS